MDVLKDRCLISISEGYVVMHDLIQEMGHEVIRKECVNDPGKRSRLWKPDDVYDVLRKKKSLPDGLKFLRWDGFPQRSLLHDFFPQNLVALDLLYSHLEQLWVGDQAFPNLKNLNLSHSENLIRIPDLSLFPNVEEIFLRNCVNLVQVYSSSLLHKLNCLCLDGCTKLRSLNIASNILSRSSGLVALHDCINLETLLICSRTGVVQSYNCSGFVGFSERQFVLIFNDRISIETSFDGDFKILTYSSFNCTRINENELCWLDISNCKSLRFLPEELLNLKFLRRLSLSGCSNLEELPKIKEPMENLTVLMLDNTAIKELPSSFPHLVGLEELSLFMCTRLKTIPSSFGNLSKLLKLNLTYCESLETFPSSIFKLKLTELNLQGCSMLRTFPEILEPAESFAHINLTKTAIKDLPSSLEYLVGLQTLCLKLCSKLESLPNNIVYLNLLSKLDCSGCCRLTEIPYNIGRLSSLTKFSLQESGIVNLPYSIAHLSSLKSLNLSDCKWLECIPKLPMHLKKLWAFDCPSIKRVVPNPRLKLQSYSKDGTFEFWFTNSQDASFCSNIGVEAWVRITDDAYRSVFFCFPGSTVPGWFPYRCHGLSVIVIQDYQFLCSENKFIGFALCVVLRDEDIDFTITRGSSCICTLTYESNGKSYMLYNHELTNYFHCKKSQKRLSIQDHTFLWKYQLDLESIENILIHAQSLTFYISCFESTATVKECGICPLYTKENDDEDGNGLRFSNNGIEESSGSIDSH